MASIQKRGKKYSVVYTYEDNDGVARQKWETYNTKREASARKSAVEHEQNTGGFTPPQEMTVAEFLQQFVEIYGVKRWGLSAYSSNTSLITNYINPLIGTIKVQDMTPLAVDRFIQKLQKTAPVECPFRHAKTEYVTASTIEKVMKLMRCAFKQAVRWNLIAKSPVDGAILPKHEPKKRDIWTADVIREALNHCEDGRLYVAINLAFACSLRLGEITGLTWDCVHISDEDIAADNAHLFVEKELTRTSQEAIDVLGKDDIFMVFPRIMGGKATTRLVLKKPKTESSIRQVWIPKTLALILREWQQTQNKLKEYMGSDYVDYNMVLSTEIGRPCEDRVLGNAFERLKRDAGLPNVVFHSLRHSSTTYKLKLNHGDIKATQGDTGHAQASMVTELYSHILDEDRKINAQKFEAAFYARADMRPVEQRIVSTKQPVSTGQNDTIQQLVTTLQANPEILSQLAALLKQV